MDMSELTAHERPTAAMQVGQRVQDEDGRKGDVLRVSKNGKRIYVSFWFESMSGKVTRCKSWQYAACWNF